MLKGAQRPVLVFLGSRCLMPKFSVYAVVRGRSVGLFHDWSGAQTSVHGFSGAVFKGFHSVPDAEDCALLFVCVVSCCVSWAAATVCFCFRFLPVFFCASVHGGRPGLWAGRVLHASCFGWVVFVCCQSLSPCCYCVFVLVSHLRLSAFCMTLIPPLSLHSRPHS